MAMSDWSCFNYVTYGGKFSKMITSFPSSQWISLSLNHSLFEHIYYGFGGLLKVICGKIYPLKFDGKNAFSRNSNDVWLKRKRNRKWEQPNAVWFLLVETDEQWTLHFVYFCMCECWLGGGNSSSFLVHLQHMYKF